MRGWATALLVLTGCSSDPRPPTVSIVSQSPMTLMLGNDDEDDVILRLGYEDGDGDLGGGTMHLYDCREDAAAAQLPIPVVASPEIVEQMQPISGELIALLSDIEAVPDDAKPSPTCAELGVEAAADELVLCVKLEDSAGGSSGGVCTAPFALTAAP